MYYKNQSPLFGVIELLHGYALFLKWIYSHIILYTVHCKVHTNSYILCLQFDHKKTRNINKAQVAIGLLFVTHLILLFHKYV